MEVLYKSTRGAEEAVTASCAILKGLAKDGGLFVPTEIPKLSLSMEELSKMSYQETAYEVMKLFLQTEGNRNPCLSGQREQNSAVQDHFEEKKHLQPAFRNFH